MNITRLVLAILAVIATASAAFATDSLSLSRVELAFHNHAVEFTMIEGRPALE